ncbi:lipopolysaccharide exporter periplasmic protein [mine drainage metagenome]|uniref:Lipopolysaccharide exporter periplasmic protein n=1 Tax=mine drainage metagenome TaxID=410659 RepID=A0A1J5SIY6_9ZZZZ
MKLSGTNLLPLLLLTLLAALTFWLQRTTQIGAVHDDGRDRHDPDFIVNNFTVRRYNLDGGLQQVLTAQKMLHYIDDDSTEVSTPALTYYGANRQTQVTARQAWLTKEGKEVRLVGDVRLVRAATADSPQLVVTTAEMNVYPDAGIARSNVPVTITQGQSVITGNGFEVDNKTRIFQLVGKAHGIIYRNKAATP